MPEQFMPQPERRRPTGGNVIALHPKLETGFDKPRSPFTGEKKGPLTDAEVADIMAARAPWEKPTEAETPDAPDNVLPFSRKRSPRVLDLAITLKTFRIQMLPCCAKIKLTHSDQLSCKLTRFCVKARVIARYS